MDTRLNGIVLIDKPQGWTSHDVVAKMRGICKEKRIGHSGTLDPMATGLLVLFIGRATRAVEFAEAHRKGYVAGLKLGMKTDTLDTTGTVLEECDCDISRENLEKSLEKFRGEIEQLPPMYSAIKVGGQKLYDIARRGGEVERKTRKVDISRLECVDKIDGDYVLDIECSKGTYIRSLCADIGDDLAVGGCMSSLRRTFAGDFSVTDAHSIEEIAENGVEKYILPVEKLFLGYTKLEISAKMEQKLRVGAELKLDVSDGEYRIYSEMDEFLAIYKFQDGLGKVTKSFFEVK